MCAWKCLSTKPYANIKDLILSEENVNKFNNEFCTIPVSQSDLLLGMGFGLSQKAMTQKYFPVSLGIT